MPGILATPQRARHHGKVTLVLNFLDEAILELDNMGSLVQTQNQRALLDESEQLLQTVQIGREAMITLTQGSLRDPDGIQALEEAAAELYRALQAARDGGEF
ncbi:hypothetical protein EDB84DRAFT_1558436 [Lactarius hengduanensis]|nr:hypothetical protein EDB84DRAFT_1558436 [Lactarius hengduanensis]